LALSKILIPKDAAAVLVRPYFHAETICHEKKHCASPAAAAAAAVAVAWRVSVSRKYFSKKKKLSETRHEQKLINNYPSKRISPAGVRFVRVFFDFRLPEENINFISLARCDARADRMAV